MNNITESLKIEFKKFCRLYSSAEPIHDIDSHRRVKLWLIKACILYASATVIGLIITISSLIRLASDGSEASMFFLMPFWTILTSWGVASLILYFRDIFRSVIKSGKSGYSVGEQFQTTHVNVTHEYSNHYKVTAHTENEGCLFAFIFGFIKFMVWTFFCVYIGPFLTFKKAVVCAKNLKNFTPWQ